MAEESVFSMDNPLMKALGRLGDAMLLSVIFVLTCIPIVTIGAAVTALYYTGIKGVSGDDGYVWKYYTRSFKQNFKQSTLMWLLFLVVFGVLGFDIWFWLWQWKDLHNAIAKPFLFVSVVLITLVFMTFLYTFGLQAKFDNKIKIQIRNGFLMSIKNFPTTLLMILIDLVVVWCFYYMPVIAVIVYIIIGFGGIGYLQSYLMYRCLLPFLPKQEEHDDLDFHIRLDDINESEDKDDVQEEITNEDE